MLGSATLFQNHQMAASPHGTSVLDSIRGYRSPPISIFLACLRQISALTREGCDTLIRAIYDHVATLKNVVPDDPDPRFDEAPAGSPS